MNDEEQPARGVAMMSVVYGPRARAHLGPLLAVALLAIGVALLFGGFFGQVVVKGQADGARYRLTEEAAHEASVATLPAPSGLRFDGDVSPADRLLVRRVVAAARPLARRLIALVAGLVTVDVATLGADVAGSTESTGRGYAIVLDLRPVQHFLGLRGVAHVTLHELAHVLDDALVTRDLERRLDAATPPGIVCNGIGFAEGCPARKERFAESFAKWATGDPGDDLSLGYQVPAPRPLETWGEPLAVLTTSG